MGVQFSGKKCYVTLEWPLRGRAASLGRRRSEVGLPARVEATQVLGIDGGLNELVDLSTDAELDTVLETL